MAKVLYITAHPNDATQSYSMAVGKTFIESYKAAHPSDEVIHFDLYKEQIPYIDSDVFSGWGKLQSGGGFDNLTNQEKQKVGRLSQICDQFVGADKYIFVTPMWNLSFPPLMKAYFDAICVAGKSFKYTESGPVGLLTDKKALHIQARGGVYSQGGLVEMEMGDRYIRTLMSFLGSSSYETIIIEGHAAMPEKAEQIKEEALSKAEKLARTF